MGYFKSNKVIPKKQSFLNKYIFVLFVILILIIIFLSLISKYSKINISNVEVTLDSVLPKDKIEKEIEKTLSGNYFFIFSKKNIFIFPKDKIISDLKNSFPRILDVDIYSSNLDSIQVDISAKKPNSLWCDSVPVNSSSGVSNCYFLDENGFVFSKAPDFSGSAYFKYYGILPYEAPIGKYFLDDREKFKELNILFDTAKKLSISPLYIEAKSQVSFEMFLSGGARILFDSKESIKITAERLSVLINTDDILKKEGGILKVDYIDMRFGDKIFYKLKKDDTAVIIVE